jgi:hypothetical protein
MTKEITIIPMLQEKLSWIIDDNGNNRDQDYYSHPVYELDKGSSTEMFVPNILERFIRIGVEKMKEFIADNYTNCDLSMFEIFGGIVSTVRKEKDNEYSFVVIEPDAGRNWDLDSRSTTLMNLSIESEYIFSEVN